MQRRALPQVCPFCGTDRPSPSVEWEAYSLDPCDPDNKAVLDEYHCRNEDCGRSFWVGANELL